MRDRREEALERLKAIAVALEEGKVERNQEIISDDGTYIIVLDADEAIRHETDFELGRPARAVTMMTMVPEYRVRLGKTPANVGTELNRIRLRLLKAVLTDDELAGIYGSNGHVRYHSADTALGWGRTTEGDMAVRFAITYPLLVSEL